MQTTIQQWYNRLVVPIPMVLATAAQLKNDMPVDLSLEEGKLIIFFQKPSNWTLDSLLAKVTDQNLHGEIDTGAPVGREVW